MATQKVEELLTPSVACFVHVMPTAQGGAAVAMPCSRGPWDTSPDTNPPWVHVTTAIARWGCRWETGKAQGARARGASSGELVPGR